jgi:hypothetical protein
LGWRPEYTDILFAHNVASECEAGLVHGRQGFGSDHQIRLTLHSLLSVRHRITGGLEIYEWLGYSLTGEGFVEVTILHRLMEKRL